MTDTPHEPVMVWQFLRRHFVRIVIGTVLVAVSYGVVSVYATYQREQRMAREIEAHGGDVAFQYAGPTWIPQSVQDRLPYLDRICRVCQLEATAPSDLILELGSLDKLQYLYLCNTQVTDADLEHLKGLTNLRYLNLTNTQITDAGLEHLKGLSNLENLELDDTQVTAEKRAKLRKALPNCEILPD